MPLRYSRDPLHGSWALGWTFMTFHLVLGGGPFWEEWLAVVRLGRRGVTPVEAPSVQTTACWAHPDVGGGRGMSPLKSLGVVFWSVRAGHPPTCRSRMVGRLFGFCAGPDSMLGAVGARANANQAGGSWWAGGGQGGPLPSLGLLSPVKDLGTAP